MNLSLSVVKRVFCLRGKPNRPILQMKTSQLLFIPPGHTKTLKNGSVCCLHKVRTIKHNWTKWFYVFDSQLLLGPVLQKTLKMVVVPACMVLRMK